MCRGGWHEWDEPTVYFTYSAAFFPQVSVTPKTDWRSHLEPLSFRVEAKEDCWLGRNSHNGKVQRQKQKCPGVYRIPFVLGFKILLSERLHHQSSYWCVCGFCSAWPPEFNRKWKRPLTVQIHMLVERNPKLLEAVKYNAAPASQKSSLLATRKVFLLARAQRSAYPTMQQLCMRVAGLTGQLVLLQRDRFPSDYVCSSVQIVLFRQKVRLKH